VSAVAVICVIDDAGLRQSVERAAAGVVVSVEVQTDSRFHRVAHAIAWAGPGG